MCSWCSQHGQAAACSSVLRVEHQHALQALSPLGVGFYRARKPQPQPLIARVAPDGLPKQLAGAGVVAGLQGSDAFAEQPFYVIVR